MADITIPPSALYVGISLNILLAINTINVSLLNDSSVFTIL